MDPVSSESIKFLQYLLPGFLAAGIFQTLVSSQKPIGIEIIVRSFIFTILVQLLADISIWVAISVEWFTDSNETRDYVILLVISAIFGVTAAALWNYDLFHKFFRFLKITVQSADSSTRISAFRLNRNSYVVLHLRGERRLYGWPQGWPSSPTDHYYLIEDYAWLLDNSGRVDVVDQTEGTVGDTSQILVSESEVEMIEFVTATRNNSLQE